MKFRISNFETFGLSLHTFEYLIGFSTLVFELVDLLEGCRFLGAGVPKFSLELLNDALEPLEISCRGSLRNKLKTLAKVVVLELSSFEFRADLIENVVEMVSEFKEPFDDLSRSHLRLVDEFFQEGSES